MNCEQAREWFAATLDDEVDAPTAAAIQHHVAGCDACQREMAALWKTQSRVRQVVQADMARTSAPADSWDRVQAALRQQAEQNTPVAEAFSSNGRILERLGVMRSTGKQNGESSAMKRTILNNIASFGFAAAMVVIFVVAVFLIPGSKDGEDITPAAAPAQEARLEPETVPVQEVFEAEESETGSFHPAQPLRYPEGLTNLSENHEELRYEWTFTGDGDDSLRLVQKAAQPDEILPDGEGVMVGGLPGVLSTGAAEDGRELIQLVWQAYGSRYEITSTLGQESVLEFASTVAVPFTPYRLTEWPEDFQTTRSVQFVESGMLVARSSHWGQERFIHMEQRPAGLLVPVEGDNARSVMVNGQEAMLVDEPGGLIQFDQITFVTDDDRVTVLGGGGGGGGDGSMAPPPDEIAYDGALRLVWQQGDAMTELVSNLSEEELIASAESLTEDDQPNLPDPSAIAAAPDPDQFPDGGAYLYFDASVETYADGFPADIHSARSSIYYDSENRQIVSETLWYGNERFVLLATYPTQYLAMSVGEQVEIGETLGVVRRIPEGRIDVTAQVPHLYDGTVSPIGAGGGGWTPADGSTPSNPGRINYEEGSALTWDVDGELLTLVTNLTPEELVTFANLVTIHKEYLLVHPNTRGTTQVYAETFVPAGPTYLSEGLNIPIVPGPGDGLLLVHYINLEGKEVFLTLAESAAAQGDPAGEPVTLDDGRTAYLRTGISGEIQATHGPYNVQFAYNDAVMVGIKVGDTYVKLLTNVSRDEALRIAEGLVLAE